MPTTIVLRCPRCKARIKAPVELVGQRRNCPGCAALLVVRIEPPQDSDPMLVSAPAPADRPR
jgi:hypothetical protein